MVFSHEMPKRKLDTTASHSFVSLFSGCGGLDLGFQQAGFANIGAYDADQNALAVHAQNFKSRTYRCDLSSGVLPNALNAGPAVVLAGSPCQGFSTIGKRVLDDSRNNLLLCAGRIAIALRPKVFVAENVPAATSGEHVKYWDQLNAMLVQAGYACKTISLNAADFAVPQVRRRLFLIASAGTEMPDFDQRPMARRTVAESLAGVSGNASNHDPTPLMPGSHDFLISRRIGPGQKLCDVRISPRSVHTWHIPEVFGTTTKLERAILVLTARLRRRERVRAFGDADPVNISRLEHELGFRPERQISELLKKNYLRIVNGMIDLRHTFNGKFRRLETDGLSPTVDTAFGAARNFLHPTEDRGLTVREAARIQGFPDSFIFSGSKAHHYRFIGNAVAPPVAFALAQHIKRLMGVQRSAG